MGIIRQLYSVQCCLLYIYLCFCFGIIFLAWVMYGMEQSYLHHKINTDSWQHSHPLDSAHRFFLIAQNNIRTSTARTTCDAHRWMIMALKRKFAWFAWNLACAKRSSTQIYRSNQPILCVYMYLPFSYSISGFACVIRCSLVVYVPSVFDLAWKTYLTMTKHKIYYVHITRKSNSIWTNPSGAFPPFHHVLFSSHLFTLAEKPFRSLFHLFARSPAQHISRLLYILPLVSAPFAPCFSA